MKISFPLICILVLSFSKVSHADSSAADFSPYAEFFNQVYELEFDNLVDAIANKNDYFYSEESNIFLSILSKKELRILRNTVFAKYGYVFESDDLRERFKTKPWYQATSKNVSLSDRDKALVNRIKEIEESDKVDLRDVIGKFDPKELPFVVDPNSGDFIDILSLDELSRPELRKLLGGDPGGHRYYYYALANVATKYDFHLLILVTNPSGIDYYTYGLYTLDKNWRKIDSATLGGEGGDTQSYDTQFIYIDNSLFIYLISMVMNSDIEREDLEFRYLKISDEGYIYDPQKPINK